MNEPDPPNGEDVSFSADIQPIFTEHCINCHSEGGLGPANGIPMLLVEGESYGDIVNQPSVQDSSFTLVVPGDSASSLLYLKVSQDNPPVGNRMPNFAGPLSSAELGLLRDWIDQGAPEN